MHLPDDGGRGTRPTRVRNGKVLRYRLYTIWTRPSLWRL